MKALVYDYASGRLRFEDTPDPSVRTGFVIVRNRCSAVSVGTETGSLEKSRSGIREKLKMRQDIVPAVIRMIRERGLASAVRTVNDKVSEFKLLGYSCCGIVEAVGEGVADVSVGDRVACGGAGYAGHAEMVAVPKNLCVRVPDEVSDESASFTTIGAIALWGVRQADPKIGETVCIMGLGLVGRITAQILKACGCRVIGMDIDDFKVEDAKRSGIENSYLIGRDDIDTIVKAMTSQYGADSVIITAASNSNEPVELAGKVARDRGRIVIVGMVPIDIPRDIYYSKEIDVRMSRSYGPGKYDYMYEEEGVDYPIGYVRWTERRNMEEFLELVRAGTVDLGRIITDRFKFNDAPKAYDLLSSPAGHAGHIGIVFDYQDAAKTAAPKVLSDDVKIDRPHAAKKSSGTVNIGVIGAGNFARARLMPELKRMRDVRLVGVANNSSLSAKYAFSKFGFEYCATDYRQILDDTAIDAVIIATGHDMHAKIAADSMMAGKAVFVEKPLAITREELTAVETAYKQTGGRLMVGFNRRFAPMSIIAKELLRKRASEAIYNYRINAGPVGGMYRDAEKSGGRIIGEVCHFMDLIFFLNGSSPSQIYATSSSVSAAGSHDDVIVNLKFKDGSAGSILYTSKGSPSLPKERIEIFWDGNSVIIDDFKKYDFMDKMGRIKNIKSAQQDKGHRQELVEFIGYLKGSAKPPVPFNESCAVTRLTFSIIESIKRCAVCAA